MQGHPAGAKSVLSGYAGFRLGCVTGTASVAVMGDHSCEGGGFGPFPWTLLKSLSLQHCTRLQWHIAARVRLLDSISHQHLSGTEQREGGEWCLWAEETGIH